MISVLTVRTVALVEDHHCLGPSGLSIAALSANAQVPRWISAMSEGPEKSRPVKSDASHPLVDARSPVRLMSTGITLPVTSPAPAPVSTLGRVRRRDRGELLQHPGSENSSWNGSA